MKKILSFLILILCLQMSYGQVYVYFQDSNDPTLWDCSWMELTAPSELERMGSDLRKFPVESTVVAQQGVNSLRLQWKSVSGGDWYAIAAGTSWAAKNLTQTDTLSFWVYSVVGQSISSLPNVFFEDTDNNKSIKIPLAIYGKTIAPNTWTNLKIPMQLFLGQVNPINYSSIKTIGFAQDMADNSPHTLLIDNMRVFKGSGTGTLLSPPTGLQAQAYERHVILRWNKNPENQVTGYQIERSLDGGTQFSVAASTEANDTVYSDYLSGLGTNRNITYRIKAINETGNPSQASASIDAFIQELSDDQLLDMVQEATFRYFWDYAHPVSGLTRERFGSGETVTSGGSGFGIMAIIAGVERGFVPREEAVDRLLKITAFLQQTDRFHGAWPHWLNGTTGKVIPFSTKDNGGDLVETAFLVQGLLAARGYFDQLSYAEGLLRNQITQLWEGVEWDWYRNNGNALFWHWSPNYAFAMNMPIYGYNEALIVYLLAVASPTHSVPATLYNTGWASQNYYTNGKSFYGHKIFVGWDYGGPLFFTHYSFLGFDPRNIKDQYCNYFNNSRNISLVHQAYCKANPRGFEGYSEACWGLTASDDPDGYMAHEPTASRDNGTISPTAALSAIPYVPEASLKALKHFYRELGSQTWGYYGFYDAFNQSRNWYATSYLAIDQGPIMVMMENYRSGKIWDSFMKNTEIMPALTSMGFVTDPNALLDPLNQTMQNVQVYPNPAQKGFKLKFFVQQKGIGSLCILNNIGQIVFDMPLEINTLGWNELEMPILGLPAGMYALSIVGNGQTQIVKILLTSN
jgi:hypothetical protein